MLARLALLRKELQRKESSMEVLIILGVLFVAYQTGALTPLGFSPSQSLLMSPQQSLANQISQTEGQAFAATGNQTGSFNQAAATGSAVLSGASNGFAAGGGVGAAAGAIQGAITSIFGGMKIRAQQATAENQALNYAVSAFDQSLARVNAAFNNGTIQAQEAIALIQQIYQSYWEVTATKIQPNRNGCSSGSNCPGTAMGYEATNGAPAGFCAGTIGATCCVGCGPIRLSVERAISAIQAGGGSSVVAPVIGDRYGLQTRVSYTLMWA
jgi:hypothetical protein